MQKCEQVWKNWNFKYEIMASPFDLKEYLEIIMNPIIYFSTKFTVSRLDKCGTFPWISVSLCA